MRRKKCWLQKLGEISHSRTQHSAQLGFRAFRFHLHKHMFYNLQNMETHSRTQHSNSNLACEVVFCLNFELLLELVIVFICTPWEVGLKEGKVYLHLYLMSTFAYHLLKDLKCHMSSPNFPLTVTKTLRFIFHRIRNLNQRASEPFQTSQNLIFTSVSSLVLGIKCNSFCEHHWSKLNRQQMICRC